MSGTGCFPAGGPGGPRACRDGAAAARLKTGSLLAILVASAVGICLPIALTRAFRGSPNYARGLLLVKCYAAGVILSTSLVHVLPDAHAALADTWGAAPPSPLAARLVAAAAEGARP